MFDPPKMGIWMIPVWTKTHKVCQSAIGDCVAHHRARQICWNNNIEVFQFSNTERENASSEKEKPWGSMLNFKGVWTTQLKQKRQIGSFPPTWQWTQTCGKKTLGQVLMVYRFQINFLLTGKTIGYPWGIHHDVYMFVKRCHGKKTYENDKNSTDGSHMFRTHKNHYYWWTPHVFHPNHTFSGPQEVCTWLVSGFSPQYTTIYTIHHV